MATLNSLYELLKCDIGQLRTLCMELSLSESGSKLDLATRLKTYYDNYEANQGTNGTSSHEELDNATLNPAVEKINAEILALENKIQISKLEHEISVLYHTHVNKYSAPTSTPKSTVEFSRVVKAKSHEPFVTVRRHNEAQAIDAGVGCSAISASSTADRNKPKQTKQHTMTNVTPSLTMLRAPTEINHQDSLLAYHFQASKLPRCEPPVFSGDILKYNDWNRAFTRFIDSNPTLTAGEKLSYLSRYTGGPVAKIVEQYASLEDNQSYATVRAIVGQRYGHPQKIAQAYQRRLSEWPKIPSNDAGALQGFSDFLVNCQTAMNTIPGLSFLDHQHENTKLKQLLPTWLKRKWNATAIDYSNQNGDQFPSFQVFVEFVHDHSEKLNHPIATDGELNVMSSNTDMVSKKTHVVSHSASVGTGDYEYHTATSAAVSQLNLPVTVASHVKPTVESVPSYECKLCQGNHRLYKCGKFTELPALDKLAFIQKNNHCLNCLNESHGKRSCNYRLYCKQCNRSGTGHNEMLHAVLVNDKSETPAAKISDSGSTSLSCHVSRSSTSFIVPVVVSHKSNPEAELLTYAMIDSQSQITFVTDTLAEALTKPAGNIELSLSTMTTNNNASNRHVYDDLIIRGYSESKQYDMKRSYGCSSIPNNLKVPTSYDLQLWPELSKIADKFPPVLSCDVNLLIGQDHHFFFYPLETVPAKPPSNTGDPFAIHTPLGWTMVGPVLEIVRQPQPAAVGCTAHNVVMSMEVPQSLKMKADVDLQRVYQVVVGKTDSSLTNDTAVPMDVVRHLEAGFDMPGDSDHSLSSVDDNEFIKILSDNICQKDGLYCMPLPFRGSDPPSFPNNRPQALSRLKSLEKKFKDPLLYETYDKFMCDLLLSGDAEPVPLYDLNNTKNQWYLPHHNVVNKKKPQKTRIVFDASCSYKNCSLNTHLLSGPDLNNSLIGVLTRFREREIAVACDIEKMFYRFAVPPEHRDFLRFLWYDNSGKVADYRMTKHIFGATSSPGTAKFGLLQMAKDYGSEREAARWFLENCFYVDDGLYSCSTAAEAIKLLADTKAICQSANLHLHKIMSNCSEVLGAFPEVDLARNKKTISGDRAVTERALGIDWNPGNDMFSFSPHCDLPSASRRSMLTSLASLFDPLGFLAPILLIGKGILQRSCHGFHWDEPLPVDLAAKWNSWVLDLRHLEEIQIPRCLTTNAHAKRVEIHTYSDASEAGYGACCYIRAIDEKEVSCSLLFGKSRVVPLKGCTIPRLELQAAVLAAKIGNQFAKELSISVDAQYYWSDSKVVLAYIQNTKIRLRQYVRNRVQTIHELTRKDDWYYVPSADNPADIVSRGSTVKLLPDSLWFTGAAVLSDPSFSVSELCTSQYDIPISNVEIQVVASHCVSVDNGLLNLLGGVGSFSAAIKTVDILLHTRLTRWKAKYKASVQSLQKAEEYLIREVQAIHYGAELKSLTENSCLKLASSLVRLDPFLDLKGVMRVGGRMKYADLLENERHPVIIPKNVHLSQLIIKYYHELCAHQGRGITTSYIRSAGYWITNLPSAVANYIRACVDCRKLRRPTETQKMADLPSARVNPSPPFSYVGLDCFGPFEVKDRRRLVKRYGIIFTCLYSRAVHVEVCDDMSADAFINCLRVLFALRGHVCQIQCDRGTNFVGADNELLKALKIMPDGSLKQFLEKSKCEFVFNSPASSHMGGVWERCIRTFRNILSGVTLHSATLDISSIRTLFYECMNIMNSRPLTTVNADGLNPLTPNHLLHMKSSLVLPPPPGQFNDEQYSRKRWRRVQAAVDLFWCRWKSSYLSGLQRRQRWLKVYSFSVGDVVLLKEDNLCRGQWRLCRILKLLPSHDGLVRRVKLRVGDYTSGLGAVSASTLERPVHKLVLLIPNSQQ